MCLKIAFAKEKGDRRSSHDKWIQDYRLLISGKGETVSDERWLPLVPAADREKPRSQPGSGVYSKLVLLDTEATKEESKVWSESSQVASETGIFNTSLLVAETDIDAIGEEPKT